MMKHFFVAVDDSTPVQQNAITTYFKDHSFGYWHFFTDVWLVSTYRETESVVTIRDAITMLPEILDAKNLVLIHYVVGEPTNWAGRGAPESFKWLHEEWSKT